MSGSPWLSSGPTPVELNELLFAHRTTVAAAAGSLVSVVAGFPLDAVKSRLQVKRYSSVLDCVQRTYAQEGVRGFFRGVTLPLVTITGVRTASFSIYTGTKEAFTSRRLLNDKSIGSVAALGFLGGASSGVLLSLGTSAFEYTKIAMQLDFIISQKLGIPFEPKGTISAFKELYGRGGFLGLYTGFPLHALRDTFGTGLYFCFVDTARHLLEKSNTRDSPPVVPQFVTTFACGSLGGVLSWFVIYPIDLVKAKYQRNALALSPKETAWNIFKRLNAGGFTKLYRGLGVSASRSLLSHGLMWAVLESVRGHITMRTGHDASEDRL